MSSKLTPAKLGGELAFLCLAGLFTGTAAMADPWAVPENPYLYQDSSQPIIHFNSAQSDVNRYPMPRGNVEVSADRVGFIPASVAIPGTVHKNYGDGTRVILASTNSSVMKVRFDGGRFEKVDEILIPGFEQDNANGEVVGKLLADLDAHYMDEAKTLAMLDRYMETYHLGTENAPNGLYTFADSRGDYFAGYKTSVFRVSDVDPSKSALSKIKVTASVDVRTLLDPEVAKTVSRFVGLNLTYDGYIVIAMPGLIAVLDRDLKQIHAALIEGEAVDNGIAVDPDGGIFVVTSKYMRKPTTGR